MALEAGVVYIDDLVSTNPVGNVDFVDEGDDHIRNIKTAVKGSFPNLGAAAVIKTAAQLNASQVATVPATTNNLAMLDASGDLADSLVESDGAGNITANVTGGLTGNADTVTTNANLTGEVTSVGNAATVASGVIDQDNIAAASVGRGELITSTVSTAGTISVSSWVYFSLTRDAFFPMIHVSSTSNRVYMGGHITDGISANSPRFAFYNTSGSVAPTYDVDYRYIGG